MAALIDKATPVLFIDTQLLFKETLAYRDTLVAHLGLTNVIALTPKPQRLAAEDPENFLWASDPDRCCEIRRSYLWRKALEGYDAWITGRKRFQGRTRAALALIEAEAGRIKVNPLAHWPADKITGYLDAFALPRHPLVAKGYLSDWVHPCTSPVKPGEDPRAGRLARACESRMRTSYIALYAGADI